ESLRYVTRSVLCFFFSSRRRHTRLVSDWSSDVCSSDLHVWLTDSGILSRPLLRALGAQGHFALGRLRCNQRVYFAPRRRAPRQRSEERRVGKEGRARGAAER